MKFDLSEKVLGPKGEPMGVSFGQAIGDILLAPDPGDGYHNKYRYFTLAIKSLEDPVVDWDKETIEFIVAKVERVSSPIFVGRIKEKLSIKDEEDRAA